MNAEQLAAACRFLDHKATTLGSFDSIPPDILGVPLDDLKYIATQRAMRATLLASGQKIPQKMEQVQFDRAQRILLHMLLASYLDGLSIGLAAAKGLGLPDEPRPTSSKN